jgi:hypothetical protein
MPLLPGKQNFSNNVAEMIRAGHPRDQALAASYRELRSGHASGGIADLDDAVARALHIVRHHAAYGGGFGGAAPEIPYFERQEARDISYPYGLSIGAGGGRTDKNNVDVGAGSYVLPADVVAGLGDGNTFHGADVFDRILRSMPYGITAPERGRGDRGPPRPPSDPMLERGLFEGDQNAPISPQLAAGGKTADEGQTTSPQLAVGGGKDGAGEQKVPIAMADGEITVRPEDVARIGAYYSPPDRQLTQHQYIRHGHEVLDAFVKEVRGRVIKHLKKLPGPAGSKNASVGHT